MGDEIFLFNDDEFDEFDTPITFNLVTQPQALRGELEFGVGLKGDTVESKAKQVTKGEVRFGAANIVAVPASLPFASPEISVNRDHWDVYLVCLYITLGRVSGDIQYQQLILSLKLSTRNVAALELFPKEIRQDTRDIDYKPFPGYPIKFPFLQPGIQVEGEGSGLFKWFYQVTKPYIELAPGDRKAIVLLKVPRGAALVRGTMTVEATLTEGRELGVPITPPPAKNIRWELDKASLLYATPTPEQQGNVVVVVAAGDVEYGAMRRHLVDPQEYTHPEGDVYERGPLAADGQSWEVILVDAGELNSDVARATERAVSWFHPTFAFFIGSATGLKDVSPGDVVVARKIYGYEPAQTDTILKTQPGVFLPTYKMQQRARVEAMKRNLKRASAITALQVASNGNTDGYAIQLGPVASGGIELVSSQAPVRKLLQSHFNDALAIDRQGLGFLQTMHANTAVETLALYGIAQCLTAQGMTPKTGAAAFRSSAAQRACNFVLEVLKKF